MTPEARKVLALAGARGVSVTLGQGGQTIRLHGPREALAELKPEVAAHKPDLLRLLREPRQVEASRARAETFARLAALYPDSLAGKLWTEVEATFPNLAGTIDAAERAADVASLDYQAGRGAAPETFLACLATWEARWGEAIAAATARGGACDDCGRADATVMVTTGTGRFCRRCLNPTMKGARHDA